MLRIYFIFSLVRYLFLLIIKINPGELMTFGQGPGASYCISKETDFPSSEDKEMNRQIYFLSVIGHPRGSCIPL